MSRTRLLHILSILETETNVSCGLTLQEICQILFERYPEEFCSEQRVRDDISVLQAFSEENLFLSQAQKNLLISQLEGFLSRSEVQQLKQRVRVRPCLMQNEMLPQTLQVIYQAIDERKCLYIGFLYFKKLICYFYNSVIINSEVTHEI